MLTNLDAIVQRLVEKYDPERIILFGSHASGEAREDSDLDLLIVKETSRRPVDRSVEAGLLVADRTVPVDLVVYTPREMCELYWVGSPFIDEVLETGKVLYMRKVTGTWLQEARDDLETASILVKHAKDRAACFHSQQAAEKALKALTARGEGPAAFDRRCIPAGCVAPPSNIPGILPPRALRGGRLAGLGASP